MPEHNLALKVVGGPVLTENEVQLTATGMVNPNSWFYSWRVFDADGHSVGTITPVDENGRRVNWRAPEDPGVYTVEYLAAKELLEIDQLSDEVVVEYVGPKRESIVVHTRPLTKNDVVRISETVPVSLERGEIADTPSMALGTVIRASTEGLAFNSYLEWMDKICGSTESFRAALAPFVRNSLPFPDMISYKALKLATEAFLMSHVGVRIAYGDVDELDERFAPRAPSLEKERFVNLSEAELDDRLGLDQGNKLSELWQDYLEPTKIDTNGHKTIETLPYLALVRKQLPEWRIQLSKDAEEQVELCDRLMGQKFTSPTFLELIWSYWHEEGMLCQTIGAISMRFQNRGTGPRDPLAQMTIDPLRPLNNLLWGYVQDEQHRLTLPRRLAEYDQEYGLTLFGRAVPPFQTADPRSRFLEAFHTLLHRASIFYKEDDDTTMIADPFPVLNALRDVHLVLAEGAHNQYGDLPWTARHEMLIQQWLLARPELREFLPTRIMVVNPERWMDRVDAMKKLQGWGDTPVRYFRDLARFGEQLLLSIRFGDWGNVTNRQEAGNWARYWRQEVQWYIHAYQTVTGVDLSADTYDVRQSQLPPDRFTQPAYLLRRRLVEQRRGRRGVPRGVVPSQRRYLPRPPYRQHEVGQETEAEYQER
jgi:hypothetical protein